MGYKKQEFGSKAPRGFRQYEARLEVSGVQHRKAEVRHFLDGDSQFIEFESEPDNPSDPNAIKVIGIHTTEGTQRRFHLGYVERAVASAIVNSGLSGKMVPVLLSVYESEQGFVSVRYLLAGPDGGQTAYKDAFGEVIPQGDEKAKPGKTGAGGGRATAPTVAKTVKKRRGCLGTGAAAILAALALLFALAML